MVPTTTDNIYLFIAELNGYKAGTVEDKLQFGKDCYVNSTLPHESHEALWCERHYKELDRALEVTTKLERALVVDLGIEVPSDFPYSVPVELDATASMLQVMGVLLGDSQLLEATNVVSDGTLQDAWTAEGLSRKQVKVALTPLLYGSSQTPEKLWAKNAIEFTAEQVATVNNLLNTKFKAAKALKDFIITWCNPKESLTLQVWRDTFKVYCNRYRMEGEETRQYEIYDTATHAVRKLHHTKTKKVADLEQFRRYFVTGLVHCLDSQIADEISRRLADKYGWVVPIHDAFVVPPQAATDVRIWYAELLEALHNDSKEVLSQYFLSIGVNAQATKAWQEVKASVKPLENEFKCSLWALK